MVHVMTGVYRFTPLSPISQAPCAPIYLAVCDAVSSGCCRYVAEVRDDEEVARDALAGHRARTGHRRGGLQVAKPS